MRTRIAIYGNCAVQSFHNFNILRANWRARRELALQACALWRVWGDRSDMGQYGKCILHELTRERVNERATQPEGSREKIVILIMKEDERVPHRHTHTHTHVLHYNWPVNRGPETRVRCERARTLNDSSLWLWQTNGRPSGRREDACDNGKLQNCCVIVFVCFLTIIG